MDEFNVYADYSMMPDPDPLVPLTPIGRVPNFLARLHAILCRQDLSDVICWLPHGRSWRMLKPCEFEKEVMPKYSGHCKLSSFLRQAACWGFQRISIGMSVDSYVHPLFLRGIPHLSKLMKRSTTYKDRSFRLTLKDLDLDELSKIYPVPETYLDDSVLLPSILQHGPKARVPVFSKLTPKISDYDLLVDSNISKSLWIGTSANDSPNGSRDTSVLAMDTCEVFRSTLKNKKSKKAHESYVDDNASNFMLKDLADVSDTRTRNFIATNNHDIVHQDLSLLPVDNTGNLADDRFLIREVGTQPFEPSNSFLQKSIPFFGINQILTQHVEPCLGNARIDFHPHQSNESFGKNTSTMPKGVDTGKLDTTQQHLSNAECETKFTYDSAIN